MAGKFDPDFAATLLLEAVYSTDEDACKKYGASERTLQRYRVRLATDPILAGIVATKKAEFDRAWADEVAGALRQGLRTIRRICKKVEDDPQAHKNPIMLEKVAGAVKIVADVEMTGRVIDARIPKTDGQPGSVPRQGDTGDEAAADRPN